MKQPNKSLKLLALCVLALTSLTSNAYYDSNTKQTLFRVGSLFPQEKNSPPVAQFSTDKTHYRIGEPIEYLDLSYDPELDGIHSSWEGKEKAYFTPGDHVVTLIVKDDKGGISKPYSKTIKVDQEVFTSQEQYPFYFGALTGDPNSVPVDLEDFEKYPILMPTENIPKNRKLIVSNDPEIFADYGLLYKERITGKARLYATHVNGMKKEAQISVLATNPTQSPVKIHITHKGEVEPSKFPGLLGNEALVQWFANGKTNEDLVINPGESIIYYQSPVLTPEQGIHIIQDIEVEGGVVFSFISADPKKELTISELKPFPRKRDVRGTYDTSEFQWIIDAKQAKGKPWRLVIGNDSQWVPGIDALSGSMEKNVGNYGIFYNITIFHPGKAAIAIVPRGGSVKGPLLMNNKITLVPSSGVVTPGTAYIIGRTTGNEEQIQFTTCPPSGSSLPYDIFFYPLDDRK
ncbi:MAG TPA: copper amine oxidase N-terminal domain-containing protein [Bacillota bacterium]|nr:copper amine oxidase N-terminal domain-containing protein [Bacillota bacterium]